MAEASKSDQDSSIFQRLHDIDVSKYIKSKGGKQGLSYVSWANAVHLLLTHAPDATWTVREFDNQLPYQITPAGCFVEVEVTVDGISRSMKLPVLDNRNQVIKEPSVFQINTSIQRCLTKAIALHGLGLSVYQGEDLAGLVDDPAPTQAPAPQISPDRLHELRGRLTEAKLDSLNDVWAWLTPEEQNIPWINELFQLTAQIKTHEDVPF